MHELKPLSKDGVAAALKKAERYRLLNEAWEAESICRDVLGVDPDNQQALIILLLAMTDQFGDPGADVTAARAVLERVRGEYERAYYAGIDSERWAKRLLAHRAPGIGPAIYAWLEEAMTWFEQAERLRPTGTDDAILRWNTCARLIQRHDHIRPAAPEERTAIESE